MHYKLYSYELNDQVGRSPSADSHHQIFDQAKARDVTGQYTRYRGRNDAVLMHVRNYEHNFIGLVGRHAVEREVEIYNERSDELNIVIEDDDNYPNSAFICFPRIKIIACVDGSTMPANTAMSRLHEILAHRQKMLFIVRSVSQTFDLRKAISRFKITQVDFEILPVNPHTGDLGLKLDESRKRDHIQKIKGRAEAKKNGKLSLDGGFLSSVQELQQSGHARVGFTGVTEGGIEVQVPKPSRARELAEDTAEEISGESADVRIVIDGRPKYPFDKHHVLEMLKIAKKFLQSDVEN